MSVPPPTIVRADDLPALHARVARIEARAAAADGHPSLGDAVWRDLARPPARAAGFLLDDRAYAHVAPADNASAQGWLIGIAIAPEARADGTREVLLRAAVAYIAREGGGRAGLWIVGASPSDDDALTALGFRADRELHEMRVRLPLHQRPRLPPDVDVRTFEPGRDEEAFVAVNNRAFAGHAEQGGWTIDTLVRRMHEPWFDPTLFLLAFDAHGLAGFNWMKRHGDHVGEIYVIGVDPRAHGCGLGRALAIAGLDAVADRGATHGMLFVAADNTAAHKLYESLGFTIERVDRAYEVDIEAT